MHPLAGRDHGFHIAAKCMAILHTKLINPHARGVDDLLGFYLKRFACLNILDMQASHFAVLVNQTRYGAIINK